MFLMPSISLAMTRAGRPGAFSPSDLFAGGVSGFWHDFRRTNLLKQNADGTGDVVADGNAVGWAQSLDPTQRISTQATAAFRPQWKTGGFIRPDGSDDRLLTTFTCGASGNALAARVNVPASIVSNGVVLGAIGPSSTARMFVGFNSSGNLIGGVGSDGVAIVIHAADYRNLTGTLALVENGANWILYWNGAQVATGVRNGAPTTSVPLMICALNANGVVGSAAAADIHQALAVNRALTPAEIAQLANYWNAL